MKVSFRIILCVVIAWSALNAIYQSFTEQHQLIDTSHDLASNRDRIQYKPYSFEYYFQEILSWSSSPNSFCVENYYNKIHSKDSSIVILSIANFKSGIVGHLWSSAVTKEFIFYLRLSRILYANKYRYKYCEFQETFDRTRPPHWSKYNAIRMLSTLHNVHHIIWIDIDSIFHSRSSSIQHSQIFLSENNKLMILTQALWFKIANLGFFMVNNIQPNLNDFLDLLEYVVVKHGIKTHGRTFEQRAINYLFHHNKTVFEEHCVILPPSTHLQLFNGPDDIRTVMMNKYDFFVWHWTGVKQRYHKMIFVLKQEIALFLYQQNISQRRGIFERYYSKYDLGQIVTENVDHPFEPEWINSVKICKSVRWSKEKSIEILGKVYNKPTIRQLCGNNTHESPAT